MILEKKKKRPKKKNIPKPINAAAAGNIGDEIAMTTPMLIFYKSW